MENIATDVVIIGEGAAGIRAALAASEEGARVLLLGKGPVAASGATFQPISKGWGIQGLVGAERTDAGLKRFYEDIMRVGLGECDPVLARILVEESGPRVDDLIALGIHFSKDSQGRYIRVKGCFSEAKRSFLAHDSRNISHSFLKALRRVPVKTLKGYAVDLITAEQACWGAVCLLSNGEFLRIDSKATVLATGGGAGIYEHNLVSDAEIGDGYALAHHAGALLTNMEFIQFMLGARPGKNRPYVSLSGLNRPHMIQDPEGRDFLEVAIPDPDLRSVALKDRERHAPFSCRDSSYLVDVSIGRSIRGGRSVFLKEVPGGADTSLHHFAHAFNGGIKIDKMGRTTVPGLYACGEVAAGPHGADRIGGCMMTATQVFGCRAGKYAARRGVRMRRSAFPQPKAPDATKFPALSRCHMDQDSMEMIAHLKHSMGRHAMVLRDENGLKRCSNRLNDCGVRLEEMKERKALSALRYVEIRNMIVTSKLVVRSALIREESRGSHYREDFPFASES
ncbi:MAG: FAD-binding protein [Deltaproteobacteria bacterium]|nr:FAD-binding protein [Deltaproteobacteria bacterium]